MASAAQIRANQTNALQSTGPASPTGKARSAQNNLRHGFRSQSVLLPGDDPAEYQALHDELVDHLGPDDLTELRYVREMADSEWRLRRARLFQEHLLTAKIDLLRAAHPEAGVIDLQVRAHDMLLRESRLFAQLLQFESRFQAQYERAYRGWSSYQHDRDRKDRHRAVTELPSLFRAALPTASPVRPETTKLTDEPNSATPATPRSAPCPCGSGLKYKRCCGQTAPPHLGVAAPPTQAPPRDRIPAALCAPLGK
ncbi:SEC-C metal-binding domain-containing protein [Paludibaculum fermentans]|uniref:SEC-C domain-containing protein n=1 Tax=Paludibaculum fermentans TaxID=1473598 RepID=UPI003EC147DE